MGPSGLFTRMWTRLVVVNCLRQVVFWGRAPHTKETLPDFREWCRVTRHTRVFRGLTGCQRDPRFWGVTRPMAIVENDEVTASVSHSLPFSIR